MPEIFVMWETEDDKYVLVFSLCVVFLSHEDIPTLTQLTSTLHGVMRRTRLSLTPHFNNMK